LCVACENDQGVQSLTENYTIRIKIPNEGETSIKDLVQGNIKIQNKELDNYILLRENGIPTYMLSVVVDDYDVGVNMIIRGDDHLNNAFRQFYIYKNMGWEIPNYAHIPLIHGEDGKKLSKRHGSVDINEFKKNGYLKESLINNLILLGWSPSSKNEIIELEEIIEKFNLKKLSKSSSIFNYNKLNFFNNYFIQKDINNHKIFLYSNENLNLKKFIDFDRDKFIKIYNIYKKNLNYFSDLEEICSIYYNANYQTNKNELLNPDYNLILKKFYSEIKNLEIWDLDNLDSTIKNFIDKNNIKFSEFGKPIRLIFTNLIKGPSISNILYILGKNNSIKRIENYIGN
jgi:glutamyl-tRNA synthetase